VPVGAIFAPAEVSITVTAHAVAVPMITGSGRHLTVAVVTRVATVSVLVLCVPASTEGV